MISKRSKKSTRKAKPRIPKGLLKYDPLGNPNVSSKAQKKNPREVTDAPDYSIPMPKFPAGLL